MSAIPTEAPLNKADKVRIATALAKKANGAPAQGGYGPNSLIRIGDRPTIKIPVIPTGFLHFDYDALGVGGIPRGRIMELFGPESSGKSSISDAIIAAVQSMGGVAGKIDAEHAMDSAYSERLGVNLKELWLNQPSNAEEALNLLVDMVTSNAFDLVVLDSVAALVAQAELDGDVGDAHVGVLARLMAQTLRKITGLLNDGSTKTTVLFINQIREKIGVLYGNPETQPGGRALKFYASVRMDVRRKGWLGKDKDRPDGQQMRVKFIKNKVAAPFRETFIDLYFPTKDTPGGFDKRAQTVDLAFERNVLYNDGGTKLFFDWPKEDPKTKKITVEKYEVAVGKEKAKAALLEEADLYEAVETKLKGILSGSPTTDN